MKNVRLGLKLILIGFVVIVSGCAAITEGAKGVVGVSTKIIDDYRATALIRKYNCSYDICKARVIKVLKNAEYSIYAQDENKGLIAAYVSEVDTTPVGVYITEVDAYNVKLEVSSPSPYSKEILAAKIFRSLAEFSLDLNERKAVTDEEEKERAKAKAEADVQAKIKADAQAKAQAQAREKYQ